MQKLAEKDLKVCSLFNLCDGLTPCSVSLKVLDGVKAVTNFKPSTSISSDDMDFGYVPAGHGTGDVDDIDLHSASRRNLTRQESWTDDEIGVRHRQPSRRRKIWTASQPPPPPQQQELHQGHVRLHHHHPHRQDVIADHPSDDREEQLFGEAEQMLFDSQV